MTDTIPGYPKPRSLTEFITDGDPTSTTWQMMTEARKIHSRGTVDVFEWLDCKHGNCSHETDCPTRELPVCDYCWGRIANFYDEAEIIPSGVIWPCRTAVALGADPVAIALGATPTEDAS